MLLSRIGSQSNTLGFGSTEGLPTGNMILNIVPTANANAYLIPTLNNQFNSANSYYAPLVATDVTVYANNTGTFGLMTLDENYTIGTGKIYTVTEIINLTGANVSLVSYTSGNISVTTTSTHHFQNNTTVVVAGITATTRPPNGTVTVTRVSNTQFTYPPPSGFAPTGSIGWANATFTQTGTDTAIPGYAFRSGDSGTVNIASDSTGNYYSIINGSTGLSSNYPGAGNSISGLVKLNNSMNITMVKDYKSGTDLSLISTKTYQILIDSSDNVYTVGYNGTKIIISKTNSVGTSVFYKTYDIAVSIGSPQFKLINSNIYCIVGSRGILMKIDLSGNLTWATQITNSPYSIVYNGIVIDSSDNVYVSGVATAASATNYLAFIAKYNSSGTLQWQKTINELNQLISMDIYSDRIFLGGSYGTNTGFGFLAEIDVDCNVIWSNKFQANLVLAYVEGLRYNNDKLQFTLRQGTTNRWDLSQFPADGSIPGLGSYVLKNVQYTYSIMSITISNSGYTTASFSPTVATVVVTTTDATSNWTSSPGTVAANVWVSTRKYI
jgi:hypothetical protein